MSRAYNKLILQNSPIPRSYKLEYVTKAILCSRTAIGLKGSDGIVLAGVRFIDSPLDETGDNTRIFTIDGYIGAVGAGIMTDAAAIVNMVRSKAFEYRNKYESLVPLYCITERIAQEIFTYTVRYCSIPYAANLILGAYKPEGPELYSIEPLGIFKNYIACASGKYAYAAFSEMGNIDFKNTPITQLVKDAARILYAVHNDERTNTNFGIELSWCGEITNAKHEIVPPRVFEEAEEYAKNIIQNK